MEVIMIFTESIKKLLKSAFSTHSHKIQSTTTTTRHFQISDDIILCYDINKMKWTFKGRTSLGVDADFYIFPVEYHDNVKALLDVINPLLNETHLLYTSQIPHFQYNKSDLKFDLNNKGTYDCCMFFYHPEDYQKKQNKIPYSMILRFGNKNHSQLRIYYTRKGEISKIVCICWATYCYEITYTVIDNELSLYSVYKMDNGSRTLICNKGIAAQQLRKEEYEWICKNIPTLAPKTLSAYTRMKNSNSKSYQEIVNFALTLGKKL
jgi:hypothetical protein